MIPARRPNGASRSAAGALLAALGLAAGGAAGADDDLSFLTGRWSVDCERGQMRIFERGGVLMQEGFLNLAELPLPTGVWPATPLVARRKGERLVLIAEAAVMGSAVRALGKAVVRGPDALWLQAVVLCLGPDCNEHPVEQAVVRCR